MRILKNEINDIYFRNCILRDFKITGLYKNSIGRNLDFTGASFYENTNLIEFEPENCKFGSNKFFKNNGYGQAPSSISKEDFLSVAKNISDLMKESLQNSFEKPKITELPFVFGKSTQRYSPAGGKFAAYTKQDFFALLQGGNIELWNEIQEQKKPHDPISDYRHDLIDISEFQGENLDLSNIELISDNLNKTRFANCNFSGASLYFSKAEHAEFINCNLTEADFAHMRLVETKFLNCVMDGANFGSSDLKGARFEGAGRDVDFTFTSIYPDTNMRDFKISNSNLSQIRFCNDEGQHISTRQFLAGRHMLSRNIVDQIRALKDHFDPSFTLA